MDQFTAGMTLVDSLDSVLMLYAYASPSRSTPEGQLAFFQDVKDRSPLLVCEEDAQHEGVECLDERMRSERALHRLSVHGEESSGPTGDDLSDEPTKGAVSTLAASGLPSAETPRRHDDTKDIENHGRAAEMFELGTDSRSKRLMDSKANVMSSLSITLTILSILVALRQVHACTHRLSRRGQLTNSAYP